MKSLAQKIVEEIIDDILDRQGISKEWAHIDDFIVEEIKQTWIDIIESHL